MDPTGTPLLTVAICTRNRSSLVAGSVESLDTQTLPRDAIEILLVDSGSTDDTRAVLDRLAATRPNARVIGVDRPGLSAARNVALEAARAPILAYLDDDASAHPGWAARIVELFATLQPRPSVLGGRILPAWEAELPAWWPANWVRLLTVMEEDATGWHEADSAPVFGANLALDTAGLRAVGGFPESLGRDGKRLLGGEEAFVIARLGRVHGPVYYDRDVVVDHLVPKARLTSAWFCERMYWEGYTRAVMMRRFEPAGRLKLGLLSVAKALATSPARFLKGESRLLVGARARHQFAVGFLEGWRSGPDLGREEAPPLPLPGRR